MTFTWLNPTGAHASGAVKSGGYLLSNGFRSMTEKKWLLKRKSSTAANATTILPAFCFLVNQSSNKPTRRTSMHKGMGKKRREKIFFSTIIRFPTPLIQV